VGAGRRALEGGRERLREGRTASISLVRHERLSSAAAAVTAAVAGSSQSTLNSDSGRRGRMAKKAKMKRRNSRAETAPF